MEEFLYILKILGIIIFFIGIFAVGFIVISGLHRGS